MILKYSKPLSKYLLRIRNTGPKLRFGIFRHIPCLKIALRRYHVGSSYILTDSKKEVINSTRMYIMLESHNIRTYMSVYVSSKHVC